MELTETYLLPAPREAVWKALNDPAVLKACLAGCESFEASGENVYACVVAASIGPVKARFTSKVTLSHIEPPTRYTLAFDGQGGAAGFGRGSAVVELADEGSGTRLTYRATAQVGGKLAQVGSRLIDAAAKKVAADFFGKFAATLGGGRESPAAHTTAPSGLGQPDTHFPLWLKVVAVAGFVYVLAHLLAC